MVIDAHVHLYPSAARGAQATGRVEPPHGTLDELNAALGGPLDAAVIANFLPAKLMRERAGADDRSLWTRQRRQNDWALDVAAADDRLRMLAGALLPLDDDALAHIEGCLRAPHCAGVKLHPSAGDYRADDPQLRDLLTVVGRSDKSVLVHAGPFAPGHRSVGVDELCTLAGVAPGRLVVAHLGGADADGAAAIARSGEHVWLDTSAILTSSSLPEARALLDAVVERIGDRRLIHGSDMPFFGFEHALERLQAAMPAEASERRLLAANACDAYAIPLPARTDEGT